MSLKKNNKSYRHGTAVTEFAVLLPVIVMLLLGAVEVGRGVMVSHSIQEAAQAGCRVYSVEKTTTNDAITVIDEAMTRAGITNHTITFDPVTKGEIDIHMEPVTVTITIPFINVAWLPPSFLNGSTLEGKCIMPADLNISDGGDSNGYTSTDDDNVADGYERDDESGGGDDD